jgi:hypothetical protein
VIASVNRLVATGRLMKVAEKFTKALSIDRFDFSRDALGDVVEQQIDHRGSE